MHVVITWILSFILAHAIVHSDYPEAQETAESAATRYASIAEDLAEVAFDPAEQPIFPGNNGRLETAALLTSIAYWEGGRFRRDIDYGLGEHARGDHGNSVCLMQINVGNRLTFEGYSKDDLLADRRKCFRAALHIAAYSFRICGNLPLDQRLRAYASGSCQKGLVESQQRVMTGLSWFYEHQPHFTDNEVLRYEEAERERIRYLDSDPSAVAQTEVPEVLISPGHHD